MNQGPTHLPHPQAAEQARRDIQASYSFRTHHLCILSPSDVEAALQVPGLTVLAPVYSTAQEQPVEWILYWNLNLPPLALMTPPFKMLVSLAEMACHPFPSYPRAAVTTTVPQPTGFSSNTSSTSTLLFFDQNTEVLLCRNLTN